jgi:ribonuclease Z
LKLKILGCHAATPRTLTNPTAQVLEIKNQMFLIDCGEGTQVQLRKHKLKFSRIEHIFISHLHGDHFFGLIGLISTFMLLGREKDLHIYGPKGIKEAILLLLKLGNAYTKYNLFFHELTSPNPEVIFETDKVKVTTIPLIHRVYTNGYLFEEKNKERKLNIESIEKHQIDFIYYNKLKYGGNITLEDGTLIMNTDLTFDPEPAKSYAFCSDTLYTETIVPIIKNATVLYHESTFLEKDAHLAEKTMHTTAMQAAHIAKIAAVENLILGHYSTRYGNLDLFYQEASSIFTNTLLAEDGKEFNF